MDVKEAIRTVLAVREFQARPVSDSVIHQILESGRLTASSMNAQPWHFVVVRNRNTLIELGSLVRSGVYVAEAAFATVVSVDKTSPYGISDASRAIQSMVLTAWEEGLGSNWTGWVGMTKIASLLGIPETLDVLAVVPFGYPSQDRARGKKRRKRLAEVAHRELFGQPFS